MDFAIRMGLKADVYATDTDNDGTGVDISAFKKTAMTINIGTITDGTHAFKILESDDNTTFTVVDAGDLAGDTLPTADNSGSYDNTTYRTYYNGTKRYVATRVTTNSTTNGGAYACNFIMMTAKQEPSE